MAREKKSVSGNSISYKMLGDIQVSETPSTIMTRQYAPYGAKMERNENDLMSVIDRIQISTNRSSIHSSSKHSLSNAANPPMTLEKSELSKNEILAFPKQHFCQNDNCEITFISCLYDMSERPLLMALIETDQSLKGLGSRDGINQSRNGTDQSSKRITINKKEVAHKQRSDFITESTKKFFLVNNISLDFIDKDRISWETDKKYIEDREKVKSLKVVNDLAMIGVSLMQSFNSAITNEEGQKQYLLQVVEDHTKRFSSSNKLEITKILRR